MDQTNPTQYIKGTSYNKSAWAQYCFSQVVREQGRCTVGHSNDLRSTLCNPGLSRNCVGVVEVPYYTERFQVKKRRTGLDGSGFGDL
jgi:hypothetical protein